MTIFAIILPLICALAMGTVKNKRSHLTGAMIAFQLITLAVTVAAVFTEDKLTLWQISEKMAVSFAADGLAKIMAPLTSLLWTLSSVFAATYMKHENKEKSFYVFSLLSQSAMLGVIFSQNLISMYFLFEMTTICSMPLVLHNRKKESVAAALNYLFYSVGGAFIALFGVVILHGVSPSLDFTAGGYHIESSPATLAGIFCIVLGFGAKAGLLPLHAWLPAAHPVAPAPASALLSGLITKSGVVAIIRVLFYVIDANMIRGTWVQNTLIILAVATVLMGSILAYSEKEFKKRLAYSSVSQISYVLCGLFVLDASALSGSVLQIIFHAVVKVGLFLCAGALIYLTGKTDVDSYVGAGKKYPIIMWCYTLLSLSLIGIPPFGGFFSKWYIAEGALKALSAPLSYIVPAALLLSALYTAGYLLPISTRGFFPGEDVKVKKEKEPIAFIIPLVILAAIALAGGLFTPSAVNAISAFTSNLI